MILVILEEQLQDPSTRQGSVAEYQLGYKLYIDFSTLEEINKNLEKLVDRSLELRKSSGCNNIGFNWAW